MAKFGAMPSQPATSVAPFMSAVEAFAKGFDQIQGACPTEPEPVQVRGYEISDSSNFQLILAAAGKFKANRLYWVRPLTQTPDGHASCTFQLAFFNS